MPWGKSFPHHEPEPPICELATGDLWREREKLFVHEALCKKVSQQYWPSLDQDSLRATDPVYFIENGLRWYRAAAAVDSTYENRDRDLLSGKPPSTSARRQDQSSYLPGREHGQAEINSTAAGYDDVQWRLALTQRISQVPIVSTELGTDGLGRPDMLAISIQCAGAYDHDVCHSTQQAHHHTIMGCETANVAAARVPSRLE
jgi:hypothetical protein